MTPAPPRLSRADWPAAGALGLLTFVTFAAGASRLGFYADDGGWLVWLPSVRPGELWDVLAHYMPGRNLHPFWHYLLYRAVADPFAHLPTLHLFQSALDGAVVATFYLLLRLLDVPAFASWTAAVFFALWPFHGETHFWLESWPMNLLSTFWLLVAVVTTAELLRGRRAWWLWVADFAAFSCALFTYDQVVLVLAALLLLRLVRMRKPRLWAAHLPYVLAICFLVWLRLSLGGGPAPRPGNLVEIATDNVRETAVRTFGRIALDQAAFFSATATTPDRQLALAVALLAAAGSGLLWKRPRAAPARWSLLAGALAFWLLAYLPIWLWWPAPRHHYLPSLGMFAAGALVLARLGGRAVFRVLLSLAVGATTFLTAAACRGESRLWERSYLARREIFAELRPRLPEAEVMVLEDFPFTIGPALFVTPQDPECWVRLMLRGQPRRGHLVGALSSAPAPDGIFLHTAWGDGPPPFDYRPTSRYLVVRFTGWHAERAMYAVNPVERPYEVISAAVQPGPGEAGIRQFTARREGGDLLVALTVDSAAAASRGHLIAVFGFRQQGRWQHWGRRNLEGRWIAQPVILTDSTVSTRWTGNLRLRDFPDAERWEARLYRSLSGHNELLGQAEAEAGP